jgi:hypothetical protein
MHILDERRKNCKSHELGVVEAYKDQDKQVLTILKLLPNASEVLYKEGTSYICMGGKEGVMIITHVMGRKMGQN